MFIDMKMNDTKIVFCLYFWSLIHLKKKYFINEFLFTIIKDSIKRLKTFFISLFICNFEKHFLR